MIQLVYISTARSIQAAEVDTILRRSRINNRRSGISGLLYFDGVRFLQALEGAAGAVEEAFDRIEQDPRHYGIVVLSRRTVDAREFGDWAMAHRLPGDDATAFVQRIGGLLSRAAPNIRATFEAFAQLRRAA